MKLTEIVEQNYLKRMDEISKDIWELFDNFEYYKKIRDIWDEYKKDKELTKRQVVRLFNFIYQIDEPKYPKSYTKQEIEDSYEKIIKLHIFE